MSLQEAEYWKQRLVEEKPINRVRVRRLLALAGAERRGWAIMRRIAEALDDQGLETDPDFRSAWIDGLVSIRLKGDPNTEDASGVHVPPPDSDMPTEDQEIDPFSEDPCPDVEIANEDGAVPLRTI